MTDNELILKFLDKNFNVSTDSDEFTIIDLNDRKTYSINSSSELLLLRVIPIFNYDDLELNKIIACIFDEWIIKKKAELVKPLTDLIDSLLPNLSSRSLLFKLKTKFKSNKKFSENFIVRLLNIYYIEKIIIPLINNYINNFDFNLGSLRLVGDFNKNFPNQTDSVTTYIYKTLNQIYTDKMIKHKVDYFLGKVKITLGKSNWVVIYDGEEVVDNLFLLKHFNNESPFQMDKINEMYNEWYTETIVEASTKEMKKMF